MRTLESVFKLDPDEAKELIETLTPRERETAEWLALGVARTHIAEKLGISARTIDVYSANVRQKMGGYGVARVWFCAALAS